MKLIVHGDRDPLYPADGGHGPIFGDQPRSFVETTLEFLSGLWGHQG